MSATLLYPYPTFGSIRGGQGDPCGPELRDIVGVRNLRSAARDSTLPTLSATSSKEKLQAVHLSLPPSAYAYLRKDAARVGCCLGLCFHLSLSCITRVAPHCVNTLMILHVAHTQTNDIRSLTPLSLSRFLSISLYPPSQQASGGCARSNTNAYLLRGLEFLGRGFQTGCPWSRPPRVSHLSIYLSYYLCKVSKIR